MTIKKCQNCKTKFEYKTLFKAIYFNSDLYCKKCKTLYAPTSSGKIIVTSLIILPALILRLVSIAFPESIANPLRTAFPDVRLPILICIIYAGIIIMVSPYLYRYKPLGSKP